MSTNQQAANTPAASPGLFRRLADRFIHESNPILLKELRVLLRTPLFVRALFIGTAGIALFVIAAGGIAVGESQTGSDVGLLTYMTFFGLSGASCVLFQVAAATSITLEREGKTFESVLLTGMTSWRFVLGKFLANYLVFGLAFVSVSPVLGLVFLFGGVGISHVLLGFYYLALILGMYVAFGIAVSAFAKSTRSAVMIAFFTGGFVAYLLLGALAVGASVVGYSGSFGGNPFDMVETALLTLPGFAGLVLFPLTVAGVFTTGTLLHATKRLASSGEDRFKGLRLWSIVTSLLVLLWSAYVLSLFSGSLDLEAIQAMSFGYLALGFVLVQTFADESPLPPMPLRGNLSALQKLFGPGVMPTQRFVWLVLGIVIGGGLVMLALASLLALAELPPAYFYVLIYLVQGGIVLAALGHVSAAIFTTFGRGTASRILIGAFFVASTLLPTMLASQVGDEQLVMALSPISALVNLFSTSERYIDGTLSHTSAGVEFYDIALVINLGIYVVLGIACLMVCSARANGARAELVTRRKKRDEARAALEAEAAAPLDRGALAEVMERQSAPPEAEAGQAGAPQGVATREGFGAPPQGSATPAGFESGSANEASGLAFGAESDQDPTKDS